MESASPVKGMFRAKVVPLHADPDRGVLTAPALRDQAPESALHMPRGDRPAWRTHRRTKRPIRRLLTSRHRTPPRSSRCCDDRLNPPLTALVGVQDDTGDDVLAAAHRDRHRQCRVGEVGVVVLAEGEPDDAPAAHVQHRVQEQLAFTVPALNQTAEPWVRESGLDAV